MPLMDGVALALAARREHADLTIVLMTGYAGERMRVDRLDGVVEDVVLKPFSIADMKGVLRKALARPRRQATA
jgi:DNA-binding response OmpR family regulator